MKILLKYFLFLLPYFSSGINIDSLKKAIPSSKNKAADYNRIAAEFVFNQPDSGIYYAQTALPFCKTAKDKANSLSIIGEAYQYKSSYDKSTEYYLQALQLSLGEKWLSKTASSERG
ncbi:MAG: hypothetical protein K0S32_4025 [Bacteroidetes bacterium]|jgi:hypothetical protein|nr:hypothetical protein [Bacteroidota bacterium]